MCQIFFDIRAYFEISVFEASRIELQNPCEGLKICKKQYDTIFQPYYFTNLYLLYSCNSIGHLIKLEKKRRGISFNISLQLELWSFFLTIIFLKENINKGKKGLTLNDPWFLVF